LALVGENWSFSILGREEMVCCCFEDESVSFPFFGFLFEEVFNLCTYLHKYSLCIACVQRFYLRVLFRFQITIKRSNITLLAKFLLKLQLSGRTFCFEDLHYFACPNEIENEKSQKKIKTNFLNRLSKSNKPIFYIQTFGKNARLSLDKK